MVLKYVLCSALAVVAQASGPCFADQCEEQLALVQRQASKVGKHDDFDDGSGDALQAAATESLQASADAEEMEALQADAEKLRAELADASNENEVETLQATAEEIEEIMESEGAHASVNALPQNLLATDKVEDEVEGCMYAEHTAVNFGGWVNDWDRDMNFECPHNQALVGAYSVHDNRKEDRRWSFACAGFQSKSGYQTPYLYSCTGWTSATDWDAYWTSPGHGGNYVIAGVKSWHNNGKEDRRFQFKSCAVAAQGSAQRSGLSGWKNSWDSTLDIRLHSSEFFGDWQSTHDNRKEDRLFAYSTAKFCMSPNPTPRPTNAPTPTPTNTPTNSPTATPTRIPHDCRSWCQYNTYPWNKKCGWRVCNHCDYCGMDSGKCQQWCFNHQGDSWHTKCTWKNTCGGCGACSTLTPSPTNTPTGAPTNYPTNTPTDTPTRTPTRTPTGTPTLAPYAEHASVGSGVDGGWVNGWDGGMDFQCPGSQVLVGAYSVHDNRKEDRRWKLECAGFKAMTGYVTPSLTSCTSWSSATGWDAYWVEPKHGGNYVITGVKSWHDNGKEDRQFQFTSCQVANVDSAETSGLSSWKNSWDGTLDVKLSDAEFFGDWESKHDNRKEDRLFAYSTKKFRLRQR